MWKICNKCFNNIVVNSIKKRYDNQSGNNIEDIDLNSKTIKSNEKVISTKSNNWKNFDPNSSIKNNKKVTSIKSNKINLEDDDPNILIANVQTLDERTFKWDEDCVNIKVLLEKTFKIKAITQKEENNLCGKCYL